MNLDILTYPHPKLKQKAEPVSEQELKNRDGSIFISLAESWAMTLHCTMEYEGGMGLAGPQIGLMKRIFVMNVHQRPDSALTIINPIILQRKGKFSYREGCLSFPGVAVEVERAAEVTATFSNEKNECQHRTFRNLEAICFQHELDHLDGKTFLDRISRLKKEMISKKFKKMSKPIIL